MAAKGGGGTSGSYYEEYMRSIAMLKHGGERNAKQLLTDRNAYISFLEVQLERVSSACLAAQSFERRLAEVEAAQLANDQKINSLSKVFRLNQEYVDQTTEQSRSELAAFASKMDSWMEKYGAQVQVHEARITQSEELAHRTDTCIQSISDDLQRDIGEVKSTVDCDIQDLKAVVFALDSRLESIQNTEQHADVLHKVLTNRLDEDLERMRTSLSEKYVAMEQKHDELRDNLHAFASEIELNSKADLARLARADDEHWRRIRDRVDRVERDSTSELLELKELLRKSLDAQHLLSATIVGLQTEVDDRKIYGASADVQRSDASYVTEAIDELQANQHRLKDALRVVQSCTREAEQRMDAQCERLQDRLELAEEQFERLMQDSAAKADDLRSKVLVALGEVEQKLRNDADAVAENALESVRAETKMYIARFLEISSRLEDRLEELEAVIKDSSSTRLHVAVPSAAKSIDEDEITRISDAVCTTLSEKLSMIVSAVQSEARDRVEQQNAIQEQIRRIESRVQSVSKTIPVKKAVVATEKTRRRSTALVDDNDIPEARQRSTKEAEPRAALRAPELNDNAAKADRLKELCLELVAMEGSLKRGTKRSVKKK